jgi:hypothetical protein
VVPGGDTCWRDDGGNGWPSEVVNWASSPSSASLPPLAEEEDLFGSEGSSEAEWTSEEWFVARALAEDFLRTALPEEGTEENPIVVE